MLFQHFAFVDRFPVLDCFAGTLVEQGNTVGREHDMKLLLVVDDQFTANTRSERLVASRSSKTATSTSRRDQSLLARSIVILPSSISLLTRN